MAALHHCGALTYTQQKAIEESEKAIAALDVLPDSEFKEALVSLAKISVDRNH